jgi:hypothetical protein
MNNEYEQDMSTIIKYELEMVDAISKGHKASHDDQFEVYRIELIRLRNKWNITRPKLKNESWHKKQQSLNLMED